MANVEWEKLKRDFYQSNTVTMTAVGTINFSPDHYKEMVNCNMKLNTSN